MGLSQWIFHLAFLYWGVSKSLVGLSTSCVNTPLIRTEYRVEWKHVRKNCQGIVPVLAIECSNGGIPGGSRRLFSSFPRSWNSSYELDVGNAYYLSCDGYATVSTPIVSLKGGQSMTCQSSDNSGWLGIKVGSLDHTHVESVGGRCSMGEAGEDGFCISEGSCMAESGNCTAALSDVVVEWVEPVPPSAQTDVAATFTPLALVFQTLPPTSDPSSGGERRDSWYIYIFIFITLLW